MAHASRFEDFYGIDTLIGRLRQGVNGADSVHAYLFCGPEGTGKRSLAAICARALHCASDVRPCGVCGACQRCLNGTHPDHIQISSEKAISVDEVRRLIERISIKPYEGGRGTIVIENADSMTPQAQNALLKTLEEPPQSVVFFLIAQKTAGLLPTILSRVRLIRFSPLGSDVAQAALCRTGMAQERARLLAVLSEGCVGRALALDGDEAFWALRTRVIGALSRLSAPNDVAAAFDQIKDDKGEARRALDIMEQLARLRLEAGEGGTPSDQALSPASVRLPGDALLRGVLNARRMLSSNVSWQSTMEMMFFDMVSPAHSGRTQPKGATT